MTSNELEIFKQSILDDVRVMMQTTGQVTQYIGARYVPLFADPLEWSNTKEYEPLTIVLYQGNSFTSRQFVPKGIDISDESFWANTGNYNAQIEQYRKEVAEIAKSVKVNTSKLNYVTPETYGAKDGEDATDAIIAAFSSGLPVYGFNKVYKVSKPLTVSTEIHDMTIVYDGPEISDFITCIKGCLDNCIIDGHGKVLTCCKTVSSSAQGHATINNCKITSSKNSGLYIGCMSEIYKCFIQQCEIGIDCKWNDAHIYDTTLINCRLGIDASSKAGGLVMDHIHHWVTKTPSQFEGFYPGMNNGSYIGTSTFIKVGQSATITCGYLYADTISKVFDDLTGKKYMKLDFENISFFVNNSFYTTEDLQTFSPVLAESLTIDAESKLFINFIKIDGNQFKGFKNYIPNMPVSMLNNVIIRNVQYFSTPGPSVANTLTPTARFFDNTRENIGYGNGYFVHDRFFNRFNFRAGINKTIPNGTICTTIDYNENIIPTPYVILTSGEIKPLDIKKTENGYQIINNTGESISGIIALQ